MTPQSEFDVAVVGAGAAGLMAAITAAEAGARVVLYNSHAQIGLKILMSGGTRCNVTHAQVDAAAFHGGSRNVVARILREFPAEATRRWFEGIGVPLKEEPGGKLFPVSDTARTVLTALMGRCDALGVRLRAGVRVTSVVARAGGGFDVAATDGGCAARRAVLTTGGLSFPKTGSDGSGYGLARALGHSLVETIPALTPICLSGDLHTRLMGLTVPAALLLWEGPRRSVIRAGSLLFTHFGLSGPAALDMSRHWQRADPATRRLTAHLLPRGAGREIAAAEAARLGLPAGSRDLSEAEAADAEAGRLPERAELEAAWLAAAAAGTRATPQSHFAPGLPQRLVRELAVDAGVDPAAPLAGVAREARRALLDRLVALPLAVSGTRGYAKAEVTAGGVPLAEVDPRTMESRVCPGLHLAGEILDVDGRLGGYNFQWAWSSGRVAGRAAAAGREA